MKIKYLIPILLIVLVFSLMSCSKPKLSDETSSATTIQTAQTTVAETTTAEEPNATSFNIDSYDNLEMIFKSCLESNIAVEIGFPKAYTCTAKPGNKFDIIFYEFKNNGNSQVKTPGIGTLKDNTKDFIDFMVTDDNSKFPLWSNGWAHTDKEYNRREATADEVEKYVGEKSQLVDLSPGNSVKGSIAFEISSELKLKNISIRLKGKDYTIDIPEKFITQDSN